MYTPTIHTILHIHYITHTIHTIPYHTININIIHYTLYLGKLPLDHERLDMVHRVDILHTVGYYSADLRVRIMKGVYT